MRRALPDGDLEAFKDARDADEAWDGWLIDAAMRELRAGNIDAELVHDAMKLGHHPDYPKLKELYDDARRIERHAAAV